MRKYYCDICKKEIPARNTYALEGVYKKKMVWHIATRAGEFCEECIFAAVITSSKRRKGGYKG